MPIISSYCNSMVVDVYEHLYRVRGRVVEQQLTLVLHTEAHKSRPLWVKRNACSRPTQLIARDLAKCRNRFLTFSHLRTQQ